MYIMCVCLFSALSYRVGASQISIIIIIIHTEHVPMHKLRKTWQTAHNDTCQSCDTWLNTSHPVTPC